MPAGWIQATDPDLTQIGGTWYMFLTSITGGAAFKLNLIAATLPAGMSLGAPVTNWQVLKSAGQVIPIVSPSTDSGVWDFDATEAAKFVIGYDNTLGQLVQRIYFTGWKRYTDGHSDYRIGYSQWSGTAWISQPNPVLTGSLNWEVFSGYSFVGDQAVLYVPGTGPDGAGGTWHMYYNANSMGSVVVGHATSTDGVSWPPANRSILNSKPPFPSSSLPSGPYHPDVSKIGGVYVFVGWIPSPETPQNQGLWAAISSTPDGSGTADFRDWRFLLPEDNGTPWHGPSTGTSHVTTGLFGSTIKQDSDGNLWLYYHGVRRENGTMISGLGRAPLR
jgi:hypothetical protein